MFRSYATGKKIDRRCQRLRSQCTRHSRRATFGRNNSQIIHSTITITNHAGSWSGLAFRTGLNPELYDSHPYLRGVVTDPAALWPGVLGIFFLVVGVVTYRRDFQAVSRDPREAFGLAALGPVFVAASLAAFAGEHFTQAPVLAELVPKWLPARLFIAYLVGVAHIAAASSFVARRYVRWSALCLAFMFTLFVLLMDLPGALSHPGTRIAWSLAARETTFAIGGLALFATATRGGHPRRSIALATIARMWTAVVLVFYGVENIVYPQFTPGVPDITVTQAWVPQPMLIAYITGIVLVAGGIAMAGKSTPAPPLRDAGCC